MCSAGLLLKANPIEVSKGHKPHTKLQQLCLDLADTLPPLTDAQKKWARSKMESLGYYVKRGRGGKKSVIWCQECGQTDVVGDIPPLACNLGMYDHKKEHHHVCSKCGRKLHVKPWSPRWDHRYETEHNFNFATVTVCNGMQVVRMFNWNQNEWMGHDTIDHIDEVFQIWWEPKKGKQVILSKQYTRSWYYFRWHTYCKEWKVKSNQPTGGYGYDDV